MEIQKDPKKVAAGRARARALTPEVRANVATKAANARWHGDLPKATHEGAIEIGGTTVAAAVLVGGKRVLTQGTFLQALGRSRSPKAGTGVLSTVDDVPFFLSAEALKPFISEELIESTKPIFFINTKGVKAAGYSAELLPAVAEVYLQFRDALASAGKRVPAKYAHIVRACDAIMRGLARVGIIALVDEATGYQEIRDKHALQALLDKYLAKEQAAWAKRFPDEFYQQIFKLHGWEWRGMKENRPGVVAYYTKDLVYKRLAPGILEELEKKNPIENGRRKAKHHQWLTTEVGHPALALHLHAVIGFMRASTTWSQFMLLIDRAYPRKGDTLQLALND
jgi:hypothetical protein